MYSGTTFTTVLRPLVKSISIHFETSKRTGWYLRGVSRDIVDAATANEQTCPRLRRWETRPVVSLKTTRERCGIEEQEHSRIGTSRVVAGEARADVFFARHFHVFTILEIRNTHSQKTREQATRAHHDTQHTTYHKRDKHPRRPYPPPPAGMTRPATPLPVKREHTLVLRRISDNLLGACFSAPSHAASHPRMSRPSLPASPLPPEPTDKNAQETRWMEFASKVGEAAVRPLSVGKLHHTKTPIENRVGGRGGVVNTKRGGFHASVWTTESSGNVRRWHFCVPRSKNHE